MDKKVLFAVLLLLCEGWYHNVMAEIKTWNSLATTVTLNTDDGVMTITKTGEPDEFGRTMEHYNASKLAPWYDDKETIRTLFVEEGVYDISNYAFYNCNNLKSVSLPIGTTWLLWAISWATVTQ